MHGGGSSGSGGGRVLRLLSERATAPPRQLLSPPTELDRSSTGHSHCSATTADFVPTAAPQIKKYKMVTPARPLILLSVLLLAAVTTAQELPDLDNDVIPKEKQPALPSRPQQTLPSSTTTEKPVTDQSETTKAPSIKPTMDFFTRIIDDFIQIPIAALRAVNQLLNNISQRNRHAAALNATASTPVAQTTTASR